MTLKSCPFCGGESVVIRFNFRYEVYEVNCPKCNFTGTHWFGCTDEAEKAWNHRVGDDLMERMEDDGK